MYTINGSLTCSGTMLNNTFEDETPYFLTAEHCGITTGNDQSVVVYWNHQNSFCRTGNASGNNGDGTPGEGADGTGGANPGGSGGGGSSSGADSLAVASGEGSGGEGETGATVR